MLRSMPSARLFHWVLSAVLAVGCASAPEEKKIGAEATAPAPGAPTAAATKPPDKDGAAAKPGDGQKPPEPTTPGLIVKPEPEPTREPGSLWNERSHWNRIFSYRTFRRPGDALVIRPTESLREKISERMFEALESDRQLSTSFDDRQIVATIREVTGDGLYRIVANQVVRVGQQYQEVTLEGKVREQDVASDDTVLSDFVHELKLELPTRAKSAEAQKEGAPGLSAIASPKGGQAAPEKAPVVKPGPMPKEEGTAKSDPKDEKEIKRVAVAKVKKPVKIQKKEKGDDDED